MPDQKTKDRRILVLRDAADILRELLTELPALKVEIEVTAKRLDQIANRYVVQCQDLKELSRSERKSPQRVRPQSRRPKLALVQKKVASISPLRVTLPARPTARDIGDYEMEHDIPDGSDS